ncbi:uncharacterized protein [Dysidea avara]
MARCMRPEVGEDEVFVVIPGGYDVLSDDDIEMYLSSEDEAVNNMLTERRHFSNCKTGKMVTFNTEVTVEVYNSPYCDPSFMMQPTSSSIVQQESESIFNAMEQ